MPGLKTYNDHARKFPTDTTGIDLYLSDTPLALSNEDTVSFSGAGVTGLFRDCMDATVPSAITSSSSLIVTFFKFLINCRRVGWGGGGGGGMKGGGVGGEER